MLLHWSVEDREVHAGADKLGADPQCRPSVRTTALH